MTRVRTDNVFGTTTDNPLTAGATTMNSAGLANLAVVSSAEAIIILDPNRINGAPEHVVVTAHTGSATSATIVRGQFGTTARSHPQGTEWVHGPIASNASTDLTAADDQGDFVPMNAWTTFTPTLVQSGAVTKTVTYGRFKRLGRTIHVVVDLAVTGTGTAANIVFVGLPVAAASGLFGATVGAGLLFDSSSGGTYRAIAEIDSSLDRVLLRATHVTALDALGNGGGFTAALASGDIVRYCATYEAAS
jgi:hypothetical protein